MLLVPDQYVQNTRKNFDSEFHLKQNTSSQVFSDPKEVWEIESGGEEEIITSGNDSEGEGHNLYADPTDLPEELVETRQIKPRKKNVRFGGNYNFDVETSETSSIDREYFGYLEGERRRSLSQEPEISGCKGKDHFRIPQKAKWRTLDCGIGKSRAKTSSEKISGYVEGLEKRQISLGECERLRKKEHRCGKYHYRDWEDNYRKPITKSYEFECGDDATPRCCDRCLEKKNFVKMKAMPPPPSHKHMCHMSKEVHHDGSIHADRYCQESHYDRGYSLKGRKKILESVQEQQEQFSDTTYRIPCVNYSSQSVAEELTGFPGKRPTEKSMSDWLYFTGRVGSSTVPPRVHKLRSRRTRINKIKNGWKKALVQTVRDGSRNERVGVIVMGSKGPEFYAKNAKPGEFAPFRKSKSFLDGTSPSFEVLTVDCKNVFLSSSEPGTRANQTITDLVCPEDDIKMEEKIAKFSKNVNDIVRHSEEKFYNALSCSEFPEKKSLGGIFKGAGEGVEDSSKKEEKKEEGSKSKFSTNALFPLENMTPRTPKLLRKSERKISLDSKAMADALNEQAKQYIEDQLNLKDREDSFLEEVKELKEKYSPKEVSPEINEANLSLWGIKLNKMSDSYEIKEEEEETDENKTKKEEEKLMEEKEERSQMESGRSGNDLLSTSRQRRKTDEEGEASSRPHSCSATSKRTPKSKPPSQKQSEDADPKFISVMFQDLINKGCAISQEESENLQSVFNQVPCNTELVSNDGDVVATSSSSSSVMQDRKEKIHPSSRSPKTSTFIEETKDYEEEKEKINKDVEGGGKTRNRELEGLLEEVDRRKVLKMKNALDEKLPLTSKSSRKTSGKQKEGKGKGMEDKMKMLRQALPSLAAKNEAAHLKQLKKYIDKFIGRVEASTNSEFSKRKESRRKTKSGSTDSSEVRVDASKILDFVNDPFKKISSEVTINIAKKLTDTLIQDWSAGCPRKPSTKARKQSENETDDEGLLPCNVSSGGSVSERGEESEPTYLKQLKKMRNEHLNNILLEVKRLTELLRFLDRCNRLHF